MPIQVKICGLRTAAAVDAAVAGGASMLGFVFFAPSPRAVSPDEVRALLKRVPADVTKVALMVNPDDRDAKNIGHELGFDMLQLHGSETPSRVTQLKSISGLPIMKAVGIANARDIATAHTYEGVADRLLLDAKAPKGADRPGGNAVSFDWSLLAHETWQLPWMLAGGINAQNLTDAVNISGATAVDVSSGVEDAPGQKSLQKITDLLALAASL